MNLRLIVAGATLAGAVSLSALLFGTGAAVAEPAAPPAPAEQAAGSDPATANADEQSSMSKATNKSVAFLQALTVQADEKPVVVSHPEAPAMKAPRSASRSGLKQP